MLVAVFQYFSAVLTFVFLKIFTNLEIYGKNNLRELNSRVLVTSNHESHLDPQLVGVAMINRPSLFPLRFMAKDAFFYIPVFNILIWLLGSFKAHKKKGIGKSLLTPVRILEKNGNVVMFPEGKIIPGRPVLGEGRRGTAILALTTKATILPVSLHTPPKLNPIKIIFGRPKIVINIGEPYFLNNLDYPDFSDENTIKATKFIMGKIHNLYSQHKY
ncbi:1-acyl-sn-glycerol-3-phosphate acyltransferase [Candidatus Berkelbacteria bacterium]|nr:1-acyl-sn-glycerol-3-phosphate acyltransferase [Candidatus Berkelbacteria bacterium]